jgi:hypothetical protein
VCIFVRKWDGKLARSCYSPPDKQATSRFPPCELSRGQGLRLELLQLQKRLAIAGAFHEDRAPESLNLVEVAALGREGRQVAAGEVALDSQVNAPELLGALECQDSPPAGFRVGGLAKVPVHDSLAKPELGVDRLVFQALLTGSQR